MAHDPFVLRGDQGHSQACRLPKRLDDLGFITAAMLGFKERRRYHTGDCGFVPEDLRPNVHCF
jgi:hypothetical protein